MAIQGPAWTLKCLVTGQVHSCSSLLAAKCGSPSPIIYLLCLQVPDLPRALCFSRNSLSTHSKDPLSWFVISDAFAQCRFSIIVLALTYFRGSSASLILLALPFRNAMEYSPWHLGRVGMAHCWPRIRRSWCRIRPNVANLPSSKLGFFLIS